MAPNASNELGKKQWKFSYFWRTGEFNVGKIYYFNFKEIKSRENRQKGATSSTEKTYLTGTFSLLAKRSDNIIKAQLSSIASVAYNKQGTQIMLHYQQLPCFESRVHINDYFKF